MKFETEANSTVTTVTTKTVYLYDAVLRIITE